MTYLVLARKYRPETFADMVGQERTANALKTAIQRDRVAHAYLFSGPRGTGKTSMARVFAKALNCPDVDNAEPCCKCEVCTSVATGNDVDVVEIDGASNRGVDDARNLREGVRYGATRGKLKIYIIDEVHMLTREAFNALLKTLEEPPAHVKFVLATTEPEKLLETIHSRVQRFDFKPVGAAAIAKRLGFIAKKEKIKVEKGALELIARSAAGGLRDSISLLDQLAAGSDGTITVKDVTETLGSVAAGEILKLLERVAGHDAAGALDILDEIFASGAAPETLLDQVIDTLRDILVYRVTGKSDLFIAPWSDKDSISNLSERLSPETVMLMIEMLAETRQKVRWESRRRVMIEMALVKMCRIENLVPAEDILKRMGDIEKNLKRLAEMGPAREAPSQTSKGTTNLPFASAPPPKAGTAGAERPGEAPKETGASGAAGEDSKEENEEIQKLLNAFGATVVRRKKRG